MGLVELGKDDMGRATKIRGDGQCNPRPQVTVHSV